MSDGAEEGTRREGHPTVSNGANPDSYGRAISRVAAAQICEGVGFEGVKESALETLSDFAVRFISDLGRSAVYYSDLAGRSDSNVFDMVKAFEDLGITKGYLGDSGTDYCATKSGVLKEVIDFVSTAEEILFAQPIPQFPVRKSCVGLSSFLETDEKPIGNHIPSWLPKFPDPHTYLNSPMWNERETDPQVDRLEQVKQQRKAEKSLARLQQRLLSGSSAGPSGSANHIDCAEDLGMECNPFLAPALHPSDKEGSHVAVPTKLVNKEGDGKHGLFLEMFAPAISAVESGEKVSMDIEGEIASRKKPIVNFRLKSGRKILREDLDVNLGSMGVQRRAPSIGIKEERDEKKRKAELILRQSMGNSHDLT